MLARMEIQPACPQCGSYMPAGVCPRCGGTGKPKPRLGRIVRALALGILSAMSSSWLMCFFVAYHVLSSENRARATKHVVSLHQGPIASLDQLHGTGRIYLVQIGPHDQPYSLTDFAKWLHTKYALDVQVLPPMASPDSAWDGHRKQYVAESLYGELKRQHPALHADPDAYLIGFTDADMYPAGRKSDGSFTERDMERAAVISAADMEDGFWARVGVDRATVHGRLQARLRRILLKDVAILFWRLPLNNDRTSLLHDMLDPDLPTEDIYESDLNPAGTRWGAVEGEPCITFLYSSSTGMKPLPGTTIHTCSELNREVRQDESLERFELDLNLGLLLDRHTDFYLPDIVPIEFERVTRDGWGGPMAFGVSGTHNYDRFLMSKDMRRITVLQSDGGRFELDREPRWLSALPFAKWVDADASGKFFELRWRQGPFEHFDLKRFDGDVEAYLPCDNTVHCYLTGYRNSRGEKLTFQRDSHRMLTRLTSPNNRWLHLTYDTGGRIGEIEDSRGRIVHYAYDQQGRLATVTYPSGEIHRYTYDSTQHLLTFSAAPDAKTAPRVLLRNEYLNGKVVKQTLDDGTSFTYSYDPPDSQMARRIIVHTRAEKTLVIDVWGDSSIVREMEN